MVVFQKKIWAKTLIILIEIGFRMFSSRLLFSIQNIKPNILAHNSKWGEGCETQARPRKKPRQNSRYEHGDVFFIAINRPGVAGLFYKHLCH